MMEWMMDGWVDDGMDDAWMNGVQNVLYVCMDG